MHHLLVAARAGTPPTGAAYSVVLVMHVLSAVVGFGALAITGIQAVRARRGPASSGADSVRRYFEPGVNRLARAVYVVPVLGVTLVAMSRGAFRLTDPFVISGATIWVLAIGLTEGVIWPGERRIQQAIAARWGGEGPAGEARDGPCAFDRECRRVGVAAALAGGLFLAATVIMVAKPA